MTHAHDRHLQTGIVGSLVIHALLLLFLAWVLGTQSAQDFFRAEEASKEKEPEVTLIFPDQLIIPVPPPVEEKPQLFIRTTQNEEATVKPLNAPFQSDRNTIAASEKPAVAGSTVPMPTLDGTAPDIRELANRDYKDGEIKNDSAPKAAATPPTPAPNVLKPQPPQPPPQPQTAMAQPAPTPLKKMMEEMDKEMIRKDENRLPLEVRKPDDSPPEAPPEPPTMAVPQVRIPEDTPPQIVKAVPVEEPVEMNTPKPDEKAFSPFTRTSKTDGGINREGANAVDAEATPLGIYMRQVTGAVEKKWHLYVRLGKDSVTFGRVRFRFFVDKKGTPQDLKILSDARDADPRMRELTLRAILDAQIPPIPTEILPTLDDGRVKIEYEAIIY
ncbi:hypothetical protein EI77_00363 [Prosthecobacter fusiformis]|uniref:TonB family protein n=1 Tax=Prosthecobacter fusiformis TaxID=48464 RepID=A0A4R7SPX4_9BACT|nr:hypothetical protein [Prosthecobacter fusiformis]TDU81061.1 hypothetical protein EI77_00363 [Prosthecobacter fusiformis]